MSMETAFSKFDNNIGCLVRARKILETEKKIPKKVFKGKFDYISIVGDFPEKTRVTDTITSVKHTEGIIIPKKNKVFLIFIPGMLRPFNVYICKLCPSQPFKTRLTFNHIFDNYNIEEEDQLFNPPFIRSKSDKYQTTLEGVYKSLEVFLEYYSDDRIENLIVEKRLELL